MLTSSQNNQTRRYWNAERPPWSGRLRGAARSAVLRTLGTIPGMPTAARPGACGILMYHRVTPAPADLPQPTWSVSPQRFEQQLRGLLRRGFRPLRLSTLIDSRVYGAPLPSKAFVVTFDDGYECVYEHALPVLRRLEVPATIFLVTGYLDHNGPLPFDDWTAKGDPRTPVSAWKTLSSEQCSEMSATGLIDLGGHTHWHQDYRDREEDFADDLKACLDTLRSRFGIDHPMFAFPYGSRRLGFVTSAMIQAVADAGASCALTTEPELATAGSDPMDWGRFNVESRDTPAVLAAELQGWRCLWRRVAKQRLTTANP